MQNINNYFSYLYMTKDLNLIKLIIDIYNVFKLFLINI